MAWRTETGRPEELPSWVFRLWAWPDPAGMIAELHRRDIKVVLWQIPLQRMQPAPIGQAKAYAEAVIHNGFTISGADGLPYRNRG